MEEEAAPLKNFTADDARTTREEAQLKNLPLLYQAIKAVASDGKTHLTGLDEEVLESGFFGVSLCKKLQEILRQDGYFVDYFTVICQKGVFMISWNDEQTTRDQENK